MPWSTRTLRNSQLNAVFSWGTASQTRCSHGEPWAVFSWGTAQTVPQRTVHIEPQTYCKAPRSSTSLLTSDRDCSAINGVLMGYRHDPSSTRATLHKRQDRRTDRQRDDTTETGERKDRAAGTGTRSPGKQARTSTQAPPSKSALSLSPASALSVLLMQSETKGQSLPKHVQQRLKSSKLESSLRRKCLSCNRLPHRQDSPPGQLRSSTCTVPSKL